MTQRGERAFRSGEKLEERVEELLRSKGFEILPYSQWRKSGCLLKELLLKNVPYKNIYGGNGRMEFLLLSDEHGLRTRIECKRQISQGSVDEKLPYLYLNLIESIPEKDIIVIIEGSGMKKGAVPWLKRVAAEKRYTGQDNRDKLIRVMNWKEFRLWVESAIQEKVNLAASHSLS